MQQTVSHLLHLKFVNHDTPDKVKDPWYSTGCRCIVVCVCVCFIALSGGETFSCIELSYSILKAYMHTVFVFYPLPSACIIEVTETLKQGLQHRGELSVCCTGTPDMDSLEMKYGHPQVR